MNVRFAKGKPHETKEVALHVILKFKTLEFVESFTLCEMNDVNLILRDFVFEIHTVDVRHKVMHFVACHYVKM